MILPKFKTEDRQLTLFPKPIKSEGELRWAVGEFFEDLTADLTGAKRLRTDSRISVCPDLQYSPETFFEVKGVGKTGKVILYSGRQSKYEEFVREGLHVHHWIWSHKFRASDAGTFPELYTGLAGRTKELLIVDFEFLREQCKDLSPVVINSQYNKAHKGSGYHNNALYGTGWTVPIWKMREQLFRCERKLSGGSHQVEDVTVYVSHSCFESFLFDVEKVQEGVPTS